MNSPVITLSVEFAEQPRLHIGERTWDANGPKGSIGALFVLIPRSGWEDPASAILLLLQACSALRRVAANKDSLPNWIHELSDQNALRATHHALAEECRADISIQAARTLLIYRGHGRRNNAFELMRRIDQAMILLERAGLPPRQASRLTHGRSGRWMLTREQRAELLTRCSWLDAAAIHRRFRGDKLVCQSATARRFRRRGELLGVRVRQAFLYPDFQFEKNSGALIPEVKALLQALPPDRNGWRQIAWLLERNQRLGDQRPASLFSERPADVIDAARREFGRSPRQRRISHKAENPLLGTWL